MTSIPGSEYMVLAWMLVLSVYYFISSYQTEIKRIRRMQHIIPICLLSLSNSCCSRCLRMILLFWCNNLLFSQQYIYVTDVRTRFTSTGRRQYYIFMISKLRTQAGRRVLNYGLTSKPRGITVFEENNATSLPSGLCEFVLLGLYFQFFNPYESK